MSAPETMPKWKPALWGTGQVAVQVYRDLPSLLLLFYMTQLLEIDPALAGIAIFIPKLFWSTTCDFIVGTLSDRYRHLVARRWLLLVGAMLAPIALIGLFLPPSGTPMEKAVHVGLAFAAYVTVFSIFSVPHLSIGAELTHVREEQSRVMGWRTSYIAVGVLMGAGFAPWLIQRFGNGFEAYHTMTYVMAAVCSLALIVSFFGAREARYVHSTIDKSSKWEALKRNRPYRYLLGAWCAQMTGQGAAYATLTYLVVFKLAFPDPFVALSISVIFTCSSQILMQPLLVRMTNRFGSRLTFMGGSVVYSGALAWMGLGPEGSLVNFWAASVALGATNAITWQSSAARLSEMIAEDADAHDGESHAGFYSSLFVMGEKIAFAIGGTLIAGLLLSVSGFEAGKDSQSSSAIWGIALIFALMPATFNALAIWLMSKSRHREPAIDADTAPQTV
jgi:GPH family glycoside/pentoside/hexuronide:cation symporter